MHSKEGMLQFTASLGSYFYAELSGKKPITTSKNADIKVFVLLCEGSEGAGWRPFATSNCFPLEYLVKRCHQIKAVRGTSLFQGITPSFCQDPSLLTYGPARELQLRSGLLLASTAMPKYCREALPSHHERVKPHSAQHCPTGDTSIVPEDIFVTCPTLSLGCLTWLSRPSIISMEKKRIDQSGDKGSCVTTCG